LQDEELHQEKYIVNDYLKKHRPAEFHALAQAGSYIAQIAR
jgi:hypothetical protein